MGVWHLYFAFFLYLSLFGSKGSGIRGRQIELNTHYLVFYFRFKYSKLTRGETLVLFQYYVEFFVNRASYYIFCYLYTGSRTYSVFS